MPPAEEHGDNATGSQAQNAGAIDAAEEERPPR
jgi:hypothetical protein